MNEAALDKTSDPEALAMGESARFQTRLASMYSSGGDNDIDRKEALGRALKDNEVWEFWLLKQVAMCYESPRLNMIALSDTEARQTRGRGCVRVVQGASL